MATSRYWADWAVERCRIAEAWRDGASILDPACGDGELLDAVVRQALRIGFRPVAADFRRLRGVDINPAAVERLRRRMRDVSGWSWPDGSARAADILLESDVPPADIVFANPPWLTYGDLDPEEKARYGPVFRNSGLTPNPRSLLLGGSRMDMAALFVTTALNRLVSPGGRACFFLPSSLYRSEGAHQAFRRRGSVGRRPWSLEEICILDGGAPFPGAGTRRCFAVYRADRTQSWPIPWWDAGPSDRWTERRARPIDGPESPLAPLERNAARHEVPRITAPGASRPRQGVNTGGAADAFILDDVRSTAEDVLEVRSTGGIVGTLPKHRVYPLLDAEAFGPDDATPRRWIFLPYNRDGRVMSIDEVRAEPETRDWLERHRQRLENRRGALLRRFSSGGIWWAMLGAGSYAFAPLKLAWEAYGRDRFRAKVFGSSPYGIWQGNQALHAYMPFDDAATAEGVLEELLRPEVETYLRNLGGAETKYWAQPGRIRRLLAPED